MKIGFIIVAYKTSESELERLKREINLIGLDDYKVYIIDNTSNNIGYGGGVNKGIKQALDDRVELFVVLNPDVSLKGITKDKLRAGYKRFDVYGGAMHQDKTVYYGGIIDSFRMSGGLNSVKPNKRFQLVDFVSGSMMIIKKKVFDAIGFFDEKYFLYYEDVDFCYQAKKHHLKVGIDRDLVYHHFELSQKNKSKGSLLAKNRLRFLLKYGDLKQKIYEFIRLPKTIIEFLKISKNSFITNFFTLNISSIFIKLLNFILFIFLIRILSPADYGIYTLVWAYVTLFSPILDLGTTSYGIIYLPTSALKKFQTLFSLRLVLSLIVFFITSISLWFVRHDPKILIYIFLLSFVVFSNGLSGSFLILNSIRGKTYFSAIISSLYNGMLVFLLIFFLLTTKSLGVLFMVLFLSYNIYSGVLLVLIKKEIKKLSFSIDLKKWLSILRRSYVFVLISLFAGLYYKADVFLLNFLKGKSAVGFYSAGYKFFDAFMFLPASYNITATPVLVKLFKENKNRFVLKLKKDFYLLSFIGLIIAGVFFLLAPIILPLVMKGGFGNSIVIAQIVMFSLPLILITSIFLNGLYILGKAHYVVGLFLFQTIFNITLNIIYIPKFSYLASAYITVIGEMVNLVLAFILLKKEIKN